MKRKTVKSIFMGFGAIGTLFLLSLSGIIGAICFPYVINTWLVFVGKQAAIVWWQGFLMGYIPGLGQLSFPLAILTWIAMLFLV